MSDSANIALVRRLYDTQLAPEVTSEIMSPDLVWDITPGFPNSGIYHGWDSVARDFFGRFMPDYESYTAEAEQFYADDEGHVFVYGYYHATPKGGQEVRIRFAHLWTVRDGKLTHQQQVADTHILHEAISA
jgi:ketosteroid isomerase-like protein